MAAKKARRTMEDVVEMNPAALEFIKGGGSGAPVESKLKSKKTNPVRAERDGDSSDEEQMVEGNKVKPKKGQVTRAYRSKQTQPPPEANSNLGFGLNNLLVPIATRLRPATAAALKRAGLEQKLNGQEPSSLQEIIELAIQRWLRDNRFL